MLFAILLAACSGGDGTGSPESYEGDGTGECANGADDDRDGYFDCKDNGCWGSSDCEAGEGDADADADADGDTDSDTDGDTDADSDADALAAIGTIDLTYDVSFDIVQVSDEAYFCGHLGICDCTMTFAAKGQKPDATGSTYATLSGTWERTASDCSDVFEGSIWVDESDPTAWVSLVFSDATCTELDAWVAHGDPADWEPLEADTVANQQFYVSEMGIAWTAGATGFEYHSESTDTSPGFELTVTNDVDATITK
jgi:hypothetical protein